MNFDEQKNAINRELDQFIHLLNDTLPRYSNLLKKANITEQELTELGEIEYFLIEVNAKISEIKSKLEHDLFGHSLDVYFELKQKALTGDSSSIQKFEMMRSAFNESMKGDTLFNWN